VTNDDRCFFLFNSDLQLVKASGMNAEPKGTVLELLAFCNNPNEKDELENPVLERKKENDFNVNNSLCHRPPYTLIFAVQFFSCST